MMCPHRAADGSVLGFPVSDGGRVVNWHLDPGTMRDGGLLLYAELGRVGPCARSDEAMADKWRRDMARAELRRRNALESEP